MKLCHEITTFRSAAGIKISDRGRLVVIWSARNIDVFMRGIDGVEVVQDDAS